ncbi:type II secretion system secretin GspD [Methylomicrobium sp. Wu6]|uniref:type II secretion system secretin GspD n=1 Tax=Methylomicrobium sp. Wu6 TaxID=3107928 RepID=UPI002DD6AAB4|nr:type II secretion system secretin GspD [Methylomicrobium sp. Wu6]MEC4748775.1 type II secretion system secretin GspD [Methylomicrobium sp. Wu6]
MSKETLNGKPEIFKELQNKSSTEESLKSKIELYPASSRFSPRHVAERGEAKAKTAGPGTYSLNFDEADLGEVSKVILSDILGQNYVLSPKVAGKVTLQTTEPLTKEELLPALEMVLRMNNAALVKVGRIYHIEPAAEAVYSAGMGQGAGKVGFQSRVIPIRYVAAADILEVIKPLLEEKTGISVDAGKNALIVSGSSSELERIMDLVATFDIDVLRGRSFGLFPLSHVAPEDVIKELEAVFNVKDSEGSKEFFRFLPIERMNAVLAITQQQVYLHDIENWVLRLDRANTTSGGGVNVYRVQHMDAVELADTLNAIFNGTQKQTKAAKTAPGQTAAEITNKQSTSKTKRSTSAGSGQATGDAKVANVESVRIIADQANNSIVIVSTPQEYQEILPVIQKLDVMPLQVLIDATIVSVNLKNDLQYGIQWFLSNTNGGAIGSNGSSTLTDLGKAAGNIAAATATGGLSVIYSSDAVKAILHAEAQLNNVKVISSPSLLVLNNQKAKINVGDQVPLQTSTTSVPIAGGGVSTSGTFAQAASIQYKDTGVTLEVTPRVNANGMVIMEVHQTVSNVVPQPVSSNVSTGVTSTATINKKEIESLIAVHDSETIVLGGLINNNLSNTKSGIPFLQTLPLIGSLFGSNERKDDRDELVVLITPRVVKSKQDSRLISDEFKRKLTGIYEVGPDQSNSTAIQ